MTDLTEILDGQLPAIMVRHGVPGVAIGVVRREETTLLGYGETNIDNSLPVDADTIFQVGSISKTLLGLIVGRLVEQGRADLDGPVAPLFPAGTGIDPRITLRQVITHTSGIDAQNMIADASRLLANHADDSIQASLRHFVGRPLLFEPGSDFSYSGPGIILAAAVVEKLTGRHYADVLQDEVLDSAGMSTTFTTADEVMSRRVAAPHGRDGSGHATLLIDKGWQRHWQLPGWDVPGGGVLSTARDLMRYAAYVTSDAAPAGLFDVQADRGPRGERIGLAWYLDDVAGHRAASHDGLTIGYATRLALIPSAGLAYAILTNSLDGASAVIDIERLILGKTLGGVPEPTITPVGEELAEALLGTYDCGFYGTITVARGSLPGEMQVIVNAARPEPGQFVIELAGADRLVQSAPDSLMTLDRHGTAGSRVPFVQEADGNISALRWHGRIAHRIGARNE
ncbi:MAG: class beta-lactamase-related serine hydrolase [Aeromicrobium sp.]|nr:class beta-lactamase-related serine hydrolase [Aeromicrobium sp.]